MRSLARKIVKTALAAIAGLLSLPPLIFGSYLFVCWVRIKTADVFFVEYPYLTAACVLVSIGGFSAFCSAYGVLRRSFYSLTFVVPIVLGLATMAYIPDGAPHTQRSMMDDTNYLSAIGSSLQVWYESHRQFPRDKAEFLQALKSGPSVWQNRITAAATQSDYAKNGIRLPYQIVVVNNASGPRLTDLSNEPGVVYYCVKDDQQQFWVTMTGLHEDVSNAATLKRVTDSEDGEPWLITAAGRDYGPTIN